MDNLNIKDKTRKQGITLLFLSIGLSVVSVIGLLWYSLGRGCGYGHSFFLCSGVGILVYVFLFINLILFILSVVQIIKPFFGEKMIRNILFLYVIMVLFVIIFDFFAVRIKSTEQDCSLTGLYDKANSEYCYFIFAQNSNNVGLCQKSGEWKKSCFELVE